MKDSKNCLWCDGEVLDLIEILVKKKKELNKKKVINEQTYLKMYFIIYKVCIN